MKLPAPLIAGVLIRRYKRFLADVELPDGSVVTAHTPNTGSMRGLATPGARVWLHDTGNGQRKYPLSWELVEAAPDLLVGINTGRANHLVREAIEAGIIGELGGYETIATEVRYGRENSRVDLLLAGPPGRCYVEVKNVTLAEDGVALFPDAVTARGVKHLRELARMVAAGHRAVIFFCVQRRDVGEVRPADEIDSRYGATLREVSGQGVEALAYQAEVALDRIDLAHRLEVVF